jgi:MFS family permease
MTTTGSPYAINNVRRFIAFRIFFNARFYYPVFTILFLDFGLTLEQFALLNTVWAITIVCAEVPSGALADMLGRKYLIVATSWLMVAEMCLLAFVPLGNGTIIFAAFLINRILSGLAEAMASGADEALAYDALAAHDQADCWPQVLSLQMRLRSLVAMLTMTIGALVYDPGLVNRVLSWTGVSALQLDQQTTMRFPIYLTLGLALLASYNALRMDGDNEPRKGDFSMFATLKITLQAGGWIFRTPFALAVIIFAMCFDHAQRMIVTLTSQYFRLIELPEASFGIIGSALGILGLVTPRIAEKMAVRFSPFVNMLLISMVTLLGMTWLTFFIPYWGLLPMGLIFGSMTLVSFFSSHYLNLITESKMRATVLSFKGLAFNLAYGLIGFFFALLMTRLRSATTALHPDWTDSLVENQAFVTAIGWSPWYLGGCLLLAGLYCSLRLRHNPDIRWRQAPASLGEIPPAQRVSCAKKGEKL